MAMALPLGKLTVLIGAGLVGSVLAKDGSLPLVSSLVSGAFKIVFKQLKQEEPSKSRNDTALVAQVNSLRHELQLLASNRPITIVTTEGSGRKYGVIIIIGVIGYGYVWWKGWKLPDFVFATRRSLSDACDSVGNQIDGSSILVGNDGILDTKRELGSEVDRMDCTLDASSVIIKETGRQVTELRDGTANMKDEVRSVFEAVETLASKVCRIEGNQPLISTSSLPAIEAAPLTHSSSETLLLPPPASPCESQSSPSTPNGAQQSHGPLQRTQSISGLKDISESSTGNGISGSSSGQLGRFSVPRIVRTISAVNTVPT
ncbi:hypothetical protein IGI04_036835 [Brassica rapa subsp. trilocularis]|uniref:DUF1664 domain-containing protein n=1 Tax=Brassica rapa subsp. trilocularis TaxID=1813537 RepID=A0ABQ7LFL2_BRACM|nr:hypothetical protein IGI04_036835 [Brassica rapa subsp. trilocularis]